MVGEVHSIENIYELTNSFCRIDPLIASSFAGVLLTADNRADLPGVTTPTLILQCDEDALAPPSVGQFMVEAMPAAELALIRNVGHCPQLTNPQECVAAIMAFLEARGL